MTVSTATVAAVSGLMILVGQQEEHLACKNPTPVISTDFPGKTLERCSLTCSDHIKLYSYTET